MAAGACAASDAELSTGRQRPTGVCGGLSGVHLLLTAEGPYLCAFGTVPQAPTDTLDWRNYRLDRILSMTPMSWDAAEIPPALQQRFQHQTLPTPDEIEIAIDDAWGVRLLPACPAALPAV